MKILQINKMYSPDIGGIETVVKQYAEFLSNHFDITVLCVHKNFSFRTTKEIIDGVVVIRASSLGTFLSMPLSFSFFIYFLTLVKKCDVFHFHEPFPLGAIASLLLPKRKKIVITWHGDIIKHKFLKYFIDFLHKKMCRKANLIFTTSPNLLDHSTILPEFKDKITILPLSIPYKKVNLKFQCGDSILYLGRLAYYKGIEVLLDAYETSTTNKKLVIVGDGEKPIIDRINEQLRKTKKNIQFINKFVSEKEKEEHIQNCCFFVFPSIQTGEAFGIIQLEVMLLRKAVINTNLPTGVPYVSLDQITGLTVQPNNAPELAIAIDLLANNERLAMEMGERAHERVKNNFSDNIIFPRLLLAYQNI
jgi:rhamnosyl/mannosyltransferase